MTGAVASGALVQPTGDSGGHVPLFVDYAEQPEYDKLWS